MIRTRSILFYAYVSMMLPMANNLFSAPYHPVTSAKDSKDKVSASPVVKIGNPYKVDGISYVPAEDDNFYDVGIASWYGDDFHGKLTSNGEVYDVNLLTAAHPTLPIPGFVEVTNLENGRKIILRINDRGPFVAGRSIDVSKRAAQLLGFEKQGTARVKVEYLPKISHEVANSLNLQHTNDTKRNNVNSNKDYNLNDNIEVKVSPIKNPGTAVLPVVYNQDAISEHKDETPAAYVSNASLDEPLNIKSYVPRGVFVQIGAFLDTNNKIKEHLTSLSNVGVVSLHKIDIDGRNLLRLRVGPYGSIDDAIQVKQKLVGLGYPLARVVVEQ